MAERDFYSHPMSLIFEAIAKPTAFVSQVWRTGTWIVSMFLWLLAAIVLGLFGIVLVPVLLSLAIASKVPILGRRVRPILVILSTTVGDASAWASDPLLASAMRDVVRREVQRVSQAASEIVLLGHSQGAAVSFDAALGTGELADVDVLITVGGAVSLLGPSEYRTGDAFRPVDRWQQHPHVRWINIWTPWDPVSSGPIGDTPEASARRWVDCVQAGYRLQYLNRKFGRLDPSNNPGPEEWPVYNRGSLVFDHVTYQKNVLQVIDPIARLLLGDEDLLLQRRSPYDSGEQPDDSRSELITAVRVAAWDRWVCLVGVAILSPAIADWIQALPYFAHVEQAIRSSSNLLLSPLSWVLKTSLRDELLIAMTFGALSTLLIISVSGIGIFHIWAIQDPRGRSHWTASFLIGWGTHLAISFAFSVVLGNALGIVSEDSGGLAVTLFIGILGVAALGAVVDKNPPWPTPAGQKSV